MPNDTSEYRIDASTEKKPVWVYLFWVAPIAGLRRPRTRRVGPLPDFASPGYDCNHHTSWSSRSWRGPTGQTMTCRRKWRAQLCSLFEALHESRILRIVAEEPAPHSSTASEQSPRTRSSFQRNPDALGLVRPVPQGDDMSPAHGGAPIGAEGDRRHQSCFEVLQRCERCDEFGAGEVAPAALEPLDKDPSCGQRGNLHRQMVRRDRVRGLQGTKAR